MGFAPSLLGRRFWLLAYGALALGFALPEAALSTGVARVAVPLCLGGILYFSLLKVPRGALVAVAVAVQGAGGGGGTRGRALQGVVGITLIKLLALPALVFGLGQLVAPMDIAAGLALVAAMPAGLASVALTDLYGGRAGVALAVVALTSVLCPLTVPVLMAAAGVGDGASLDGAQLAAQAGYIAALLGIPAILALVTRRVAKAWVARNHARFGPSAIASLCALMLVAAAASRPSWQGRGAQELLEALGWTTALCFLFAGVALTFGRLFPRGDRVGLSMNLIYVNHGLAVAFALRFVGDLPAFVLPPVLLQVPVVATVVVVGGWLSRERVRA